jgi:hypothetical protein
MPSAGAVAASLIGYGAAQVSVHPVFQRIRHAVITVLVNIDIHLARALESASDGLLTFDREGKRAVLSGMCSVASSVAF